MTRLVEPGCPGVTRTTPPRLSPPASATRSTVLSPVAAPTCETGTGSRMHPGRQPVPVSQVGAATGDKTDRKSTRLNSSHSQISYAVFCLKKKKKTDEREPIKGSCRPALPDGRAHGARNRCRTPDAPELPLLRALSQPRTPRSRRLLSPDA